LIFEQVVLIGLSQVKYEALNQVYLQADALMLISGERVVNDSPNQASSPSSEPMYKEEMKIRRSA